MNGAETVIAAALAGGVEVCFANPGTTELPLVLALDAVSGMRGVLCLHENVATGAADGYARMAGKPAMCLLHLGPGLANGLTNLHNARRAFTPILNVIGEHTTWHLPADPLLASDIEQLAGTVSNAVIRLSPSGDIGAALRDALDATRAGGGGIATLIVPQDIQTEPAAPAARPASTSGHRQANAYDSGKVEAAAKALKSGRGALLLGGEALSEEALLHAADIAAVTGARLICDTFFARMERGGDLPSVTKLPYFPDAAMELTRGFDRVVIAGTRRPVAFFGYSGQPSYMTSDAQTLMLAREADDAVGALAALAQALAADGKRRNAPAKSARPHVPAGRLDAQTVSATIAALQPENCIMMDEALTVGVPYFEASQSAPRFSHLMLTGGAIGQGPSSATGAALASPQRKVVNFQSDGCGAYSVQALWTQARENLDVLTVIGSNRSYNILSVEMLRAGVSSPGPIARAMASLDKPHLDWVKISEGFGVPAVAVETAEALAREIERGLANRGPRLIEAIMA